MPKQGGTFLVTNSLDKSKELYLQGRESMEKGDLDQAVALFLDSTNALAHFKTLELLGECLLKLNRHNEASIYLAAASVMGTRAFRARFLLAQALVPLGEIEKAVEVLNDALELNPNYKAAKDFLQTLKPPTIPQLDPGT
jgi:tetratricopeptide (TPR) repeat protein